MQRSGEAGWLGRSAQIEHPIEAKPAGRADSTYHLDLFNHRWIRVAVTAITGEILASVSTEGNYFGHEHRRGDSYRSRVTWTIVQTMDEDTADLRTRRREQTRDEIVRAAFDLFGRKGYERVSMDAIAGAAGVSRATLFNYFPQKELMLREIAAARAAKLKAVVSEFALCGGTPSFDAVTELVLKLAAENARITGHAKKLILATMFQQASQGLLLAARQEAIGVLATALRKMPKRRKPARLVAETLFAVFIATMLEWLMREEAPAAWLTMTMRQRLQALKEGVA